jgi:hypothetical protein
MNKTPVKETARQAGPHMRRIPPFDPISSSFPVPGPQYCGSADTYNAYGQYEDGIMSIEVDLVVSVPASSGSPSTTRLIPGVNVRWADGRWNCPYDAADFPEPGMPAVLIVRGTTTQGTVILYVPFSCNTTPAKRGR